MIQKILILSILASITFNCFAQDVVTLFGKITAVEGESVIVQLKSKEKVIGLKKIFLNLDYEDLDFQYFEISKNDLKDLSLKK